MRYDITFTGRVQGVSFRWTTCRVAERFKLAGWVRNQQDGTVRCVVEGEAAELDAFVGAVQDAMAGNVGDTRICRGTDRGELEGFGIRS